MSQHNDKLNGKKHPVSGKISKEKKQEDMDYDYQLITLCNTSCVHQNMYTYNYGTKNEICTSICKLINECYANNKSITEDTFTTIMTYITKKPHYYQYSNNSCLQKNPSLIADTLSLLFKHYLPINSMLGELVKIQVYDVCYKNFNLNPKFVTFDNTQIDLIIKNRLEFSCGTDDTELVDVLIKNMEITKDNLYKLCDCRSTVLSFVLSSIIDKFSEEITTDFMDKSCESLPYTKYTVQSLLNRGLQFTSKHLNIVCAKGNSESIEYVLQLSRIPLTREHYKSLVTSKNYSKKIDDYDTSVRYWRQTPKEDLWVNGYTLDKMEMLIKYGYKPDYEDVEYGIKHKVEIPGVDRFDIKLDKKLLELSWDNDFYPQYKFDCIEPSMVELQKLCKGKKLRDMKLLIKNNKLTPDRKCMENISCFKNNNQIYDYMILSGGQVTYKCIKNCTKEMNNNHFLTKLVDSFEIVYNEEITNYQNRITDLENQIKELGGVVKESPVKIPNKIIQDIKPKNIENDNDEDDNDIISSDESIDEEIPIKKGVKKMKSIITKKTKKILKMIVNMIVKMIVKMIVMMILSMSYLIQIMKPLQPNLQSKKSQSKNHQSKYQKKFQPKLKM